MAIANSKEPTWSPWSTFTQSGDAVAVPGVVDGHRLDAVHEAALVVPVHHLRTEVVGELRRQVARQQRDALRLRVGGGQTQLKHGVLVAVDEEQEVVRQTVWTDFTPKNNGAAQTVTIDRILKMLQFKWKLQAII